MNFKALVEAIAEIHRRTHYATIRAVNVALTCRNWLIGAYIHEYELRGQDRAEYGERLMEQLANALRGHRVPVCDRPRLYAYLTFYRAYLFSEFRRQGCSEAGFRVLPISNHGYKPNFHQL